MFTLKRTQRRIALYREYRVYSTELYQLGVLRVTFWLHSIIQRFILTQKKQKVYSAELYQLVASCVTFWLYSVTQRLAQRYTAFYFNNTSKVRYRLDTKVFNHEEHKVLKTKYNNVYFEKDTKALRFIQRIKGLFRGALLVGCASCYVLVAQSYTKFGTECHRVFFNNTSKVRYRLDTKVF